MLGRYPTTRSPRPTHGCRSGYLCPQFTAGELDSRAGLGVREDEEIGRSGEDVFGVVQRNVGKPGCARHRAVGQYDGGGAVPLPQRRVVIEGDSSTFALGVQGTSPVAVAGFVLASIGVAPILYASILESYSLTGPEASHVTCCSGSAGPRIR